ncbi:DExH-box splicing factor binding site-domain-containing protein [Hypoxylon argillaceum]|nr:DExH-box splicing factor binding site-domain-containing protein [Hypoxylon argillaceum]KAI1155053.1 DExH-box splicing factor binding site-domain-containing protein [Nemania diffusa]
MSETPPKSQAPRIAIRFGAPSSAGSKRSSHATNRRGQSQPSSALGKRQRPNALHSDPESGEDDHVIGKHQAISVIDADNPSSISNAVSASSRRNKEYVIGSQKNRDWKADVKTRKRDRATSPHSFIKKDNSETAPADQDKDVKWGLNIRKKSAQEDMSCSDDRPKEQEKDAIDMATPLSDSLRDADKDAMNALLGRRNPTQQFMIKDNDNNVSNKPQFSEQDAYQRGMHEAVEVSTIEEYSEIPEGEFGAAMLRGMGWKGEEFGTKPKEAKRRPHLMGLGSKEDAEIKKAELSKQQGYRERRPRLDQYRRDREKEKQERSGRYRDSYKSEREREQRDQNYDHRHRERHRERDNHSHR